MVFSGIFLVLQFIYVPFLRTQFGLWTGVLAYELLTFRWLTYYSLISLILFLFGLQACVIFFREETVIKNKTLKNAALLLPVILGILFFSLFVYSGIKTLKSGQMTSAALPPPKILWATLAVNLKGLEKDRSSLSFIRGKLEDQGNAIDVSNVKRISDDQIPYFLKETGPSLDDFYIQHHPTPYPWGCPADKDGTQMTHHNNAAVLSGVRLPSQRVLFATNSPVDVGLSNGLLLNNSLTGIDGRYMAGFPPMHFLYYYPGNSFLAVGNTGFISSLGWVLSTENMLAPANRKILDIAGIDIFVVDRAAYQKLGEDLGLKTLPYTLPAVYDPNYLVLENTRSYGLAYLARSIRYVDPGLLEKAVQNFKLPFYLGPVQTYYHFTRALKNLRDTLTAVDGKHALIIEDEKKAGQTEILEPSSNTLKIENFIGNRAAFRVHCEKEPCRLVFNTSAIRGWKAFADGKQLPVQRANFAFLSVDVPGGDHLVWFEHRLDFPILMSFITLLAFIIILLL